jgi:hypothetical protein
LDKVVLTLKTDDALAGRRAAPTRTDTGIAEHDVLLQMAGEYYKRKSERY